MTSVDYRAALKYPTLPVIMIADVAAKKAVSNINPQIKFRFESGLNSSTSSY